MSSLKQFYQFHKGQTTCKNHDYQRQQQFDLAMQLTASEVQSHQGGNQRKFSSVLLITLGYSMILSAN